MIDLDQIRNEYEATLRKKRGSIPGEQDGSSGEFHATRFRERAWRGEVEETWRTTYKQSAQEAAEWGRLTRLREKVVVAEVSAKPSLPPSALSVAAKTSLAKPPVVNVREIVQDAARLGAATRLPEKIVRNYVKADAGDDDEDKDTAEYEGSTQVAATRPARTYLHSSVDDVVLPRTPPAVVQKLRDAAIQRRNEIDIRPMVELSRQVAFASWQRRQRLQHQGAQVRVKPGCSCAWCQTSSPYQTVAYQQRQRQGLGSSPELVDGFRERAKPLNLVVVDAVPSFAQPLVYVKDDDESSGYTEITVSTNDEQFYPVIECPPMDLQRRTSDLTFEEASLLLGLAVPPTKPAACDPATTKDGTGSSTAHHTAQTSRTTQSSSQAVPTTSKKLKKAQPQPPTKRVLPTKHPERKMNCKPRPKPLPTASPKRQAGVAPRSTTTSKTAENRRRRAPGPRRRERPDIEYVMMMSEDVSTLSLPGYFEDKLERAILDQMYKPIPAASPAPLASAGRDPSACRVTRFFQSHFGGHK